MAQRVSDAIQIDAAPQRVCDVAADIESYPSWQPDIKDLEVRETDEEGRAARVWMRVDARVRVVSYTLEYDYSRAPQSFSWKLVDGDLKSLEGSYTFEEMNGGTQVSYELSIDPGFRIPGMLKRQAERHIVKSALQGLKRRVESG
ncbi:MAG TPA: SRPBCC family protein [Actinomycetota bacterium]|jgi:ribosome-associated toxin RatA of RatAB toxin-antitoxin module|nr:SRPBCC family protein [Actinomycetota bacterium]